MVESEKESLDATEPKPSVLYFTDDVEHLNISGVALREVFEITVASSATVARSLCISRKTFTLIVADMGLQDMDVIDFLNRLSGLSPRSVRILVTDATKIDAAIEAVRAGIVSRFVCRPFPDSHLISVLKVATKQYRAGIAEQERLVRYVIESLNVLADTIAGYEPELCRRAERVAHRSGEVAARIGEPARWVMEASAIFYHASWLPLVPEMQEQLWFCSAGTMKTRRTQSFEVLPSHSIAALRGIPLIDLVDEILRGIRELEATPFDASKSPPIGARILTTVSAIDELESRGASFDEAAIQISQSKTDPGCEILNALRSMQAIPDQVTRSVELSFTSVRARAALTNSY